MNPSPGPGTRPSPGSSVDVARAEAFDNDAPPPQRRVDVLGRSQGSNQQESEGEH